MFKVQNFTFILIITFALIIVLAQDCSDAKLHLQNNRFSGFCNTQKHKSYVVFFKPETELNIVRDAEAEVEFSGGVITHRYRAGVIGFAATIPVDLITTFSSSPHVQVVEEDQEVHTYNTNENKFGI